jgi:hypothetical protein
VTIHSCFGFFLLGRPLKHPNQKGDMKQVKEMTYNVKSLKGREDFKGLPPSTTPWKEKSGSAMLI